MPTPRPTIVATVGEEVLTSVVAASSVIPETPAVRPAPATPKGRAEVDDEDEQGDPHADQLTGAAEGLSRCVRQVAPQLHLVAVVDRPGDGALERLDVAHQVRVGDRLGVLDGEHGRVTVGADARRTDLGHVLEVLEPGGQL